jgi:hypothetical protein
MTSSYGLSLLEDETAFINLCRIIVVPAGEDFVYNRGFVGRIVVDHHQSTGFL